MAGVFDPRPPRDDLTCLLHGVPRYKPLQNDYESTRKAEKPRWREQAALPARKPAASNPPKRDATAATSWIAHSRTSSFWSTDAIVPSASRPAYTRPIIALKTAQRSVSVTPPPASLATPVVTPGPSESSSTSRRSSKRPHTPDDEEARPLPPPPKPRGRKKPAVRKGWKGWVEGSPQPSDKLINLDAVPVLQERRTRSGKSFDAIGIGIPTGKGSHWQQPMVIRDMPCSLL
ncbi:hypothetical protein C0995_003280 [Termitomyces sp. Mi166|nr:hypothetical protein C0995_003280 [Termitomyces sp. Mi166\